MLETVSIKTSREASLGEYLETLDFFVENVTDHVTKVTREGEQPVYIHKDGNNLYFEVDLGGIAGVGSQDLYFDLLNLNTTILPVSVGIDSTDADDPRLVLVESREVTNLDDNEVLSVFNALELACDKVEEILAKHISNGGAA